MGPRIPVLTLIRDGLMGRHTGLSSQRASSHSALSEGEPPAFQVQPSSPPTPPPPRYACAVVGLVDVGVKDQQEDAVDHRPEARAHVVEHALAVHKHMQAVVGVGLQGGAGHTLCARRVGRGHVNVLPTCQGRRKCVGLAQILRPLPFCPR